MTTVAVASAVAAAGRTVSTRGRGSVLGPIGGVADVVGVGLSVVDAGEVRAF
ncbi:MULTISPECIES: hypothetical protein [unclassified Streptomyces]|uniref:hypothetical protein n=1 Tax=unclassified Streptomyces TaxID=2593676 RepID=UPI001370E183|nr:MULTISPECIES: hypothetical protein [unclassified Streptomyces]MYS23982.1 hypothetical protein [Streptomyces sp. SID4948]